MNAITLKNLNKSGAAEISKFVTPQGLSNFIIDLAERGYMYSRTSTRCGYVPLNYVAISFEYAGQWGRGYCIATYDSESTVKLSYYIMKGTGCKNGTKRKNRHNKNRA